MIADGFRRRAKTLEGRGPSEILLLLLLALPLAAGGHGTEFIQAKLALARDGTAQLEMTADCGENPMLHGEEHARSVLVDLLRIRSADGSRALAEFAEPRFEQRVRFDPTSPLGADPATIADRRSETGPTISQLPFPVSDHRLLTAIWRWKPRTDSLVFEIPRGNPHDVVFWTIDAGLPQTPPRWLYLIAGDHTPEIALPYSSRPWIAIGCAVAAAALGIATPFLLRRSRRSTDRAN